MLCVISPGDFQEHSIQQPDGCSQSNEIQHLSVLFCFLAYPSHFPIVVVLISTPRSIIQSGVKQRMNVAIKKLKSGWRWFGKCDVECEMGVCVSRKESKQVGVGLG